MLLVATFSANANRKIPSSQGIYQDAINGEKIKYETSKKV
jgi:hypothetical protein